ncbi:MAG: tungstate transporter permease [Nitrospirae bacterium GWC2_56_14]|nr:MAG: tungstate transporter permease [Nitrospirae bacterium GWC2_56_14]
MDSITQGFIRAFELIFHLNAELFGIILLSLKVSGLALVIATLAGLPLGAMLGLKRFPGRNLAISAVNTLMGLPPVVVGLFVYLILSRKGPLGFLGLLYSPTAMIIAQSILAIPIVTALCHSAIVNVDPLIRQASRTLGATQRQETLAIIHEARYGIISAIVAAFGRVMAEVGSILIVGGNIAGYTRVMTTTIALETDKGNFELALALGIILLLLSFIVNAVLHAIQRKGMVATQ